MKRIWTLALTVILLAFVGLFTTAPIAQAANKVVSDCGDNGAAHQLRAQLTAAQSSGGGTITFKCSPTITLLNGVLPAITSNITLDGNHKITINGNNATRIFKVASTGTLTLKNITISNAFYNSDGGAINSQGTLHISHTLFSNNKAGDNYSGGAIFASGPTDISDSEFSTNSAGNGGALALFHSAAVVTLTRSSLHDNYTPLSDNGWGGAMLVFDGASVTVNTSTFTANVANDGGAAYIYQGPSATHLTVTSSTFTANQADLKGGVFANDSGTLLLENDTLVNNSADEGGAVYNDGTTSLNNVTLSGNIGRIKVGGIYGGATLHNTVLVHGSSGANCDNSMSGSFNLSDDSSCSFGTGRDNVNPHLGALGDNQGLTQTMLPQSDSLALDAGTSTYCATIDQRGIPRPQGTTCDVGAVEVIHLPSGCTAKPGKSQLVLPANGAATNPKVKLKWSAAHCATNYQVVVVQDTKKGDLVDKSNGIKLSHKTALLLAGRTFYWYVQSCNNLGCAKSAVQSFTTH